MARRKTIEVEKVRELANQMLKTESGKGTLSDGRDVWSQDVRDGVSRLLEAILHATDNYKGYNFVAWWDEGGCERWRADDSPKDNTLYLGDQTRRVYF